MTSRGTISSLHQSIDLIERYAKCVLENSNRETTNLEELGPYILYFSNAVAANQAKEEIFDEFVNMIDSSSEQLDSEEVLKKFNEKINSVKTTIKKPEKCEKYVSFMNLISELNSHDDDIEAVSQAVNLIDPISKLPISEPVKNKKCGHVYDKKTILQFLKKYPKTKCPVAGCISTDYIKESLLVPDNSLKKHSVLE